MCISGEGEGSADVVGTVKSRLVTVRPLVLFSFGWFAWWLIIVGCRAKLVEDGVWNWSRPGENMSVVVGMKMARRINRVSMVASLCGWFLVMICRSFSGASSQVFSMYERKYSHVSRFFNYSIPNRLTKSLRSCAWGVVNSRSNEGGAWNYKALESQVGGLVGGEAFYKLKAEGVRAS